MVRMFKTVYKIYTIRCSDCLSKVDEYSQRLFYNFKKVTVTKAKSYVIRILYSLTISLHVLTDSVVDDSEDFVFACVCVL